MDTPERNQIGTPISKFEDSPVFNYINSLSPIKPVKSLHITQAFSSISFASLPSIFTSPHVSAHKESRFLRRHCISDPSKPEFSSENETGNEVGTGEGVVLDAAEQYNESAVRHESCDSAITVGEASAEQNNDDSNFVIELPQKLKYDCGSPIYELAPSGIKVDSVVELDDQFALPVPSIQETSQKGSSDGEAQVQEMCQIEQKQDPAVRDWEGLICDTSDLLIFNSPNTTESLNSLMQISLEPVTSFSDTITPQLPENDILDERNMHSSNLVNYSEQQKTEDISSQPGEAVSLEKTEQVQGTIAITCLNDVASNKMDEGKTFMEITCKSVLNLHRGLRRRCLDFELAGARRKNIRDGSTSNSSSISSQSDEIVNLSDKQLVQIKPGGDSRCILPGIGLHLNALASNSKDYRKLNNENLSCGSHPGIHSSTAAYADQEHPHKSGTSDCSERDIDTAGNGVQLMQDERQVQSFLASEEFNQNSPKKKRCKIDNVGDSEAACKRCNCKKSKCLKLYCECFAAGLYCTEPCSCQDCFNKPIHEDTVLATRKQIESRNPLAFAPKVIRNSVTVPEYGDESSKTPASARHKRGCNCKKSNCLKKYCECYQGGVGCSIGCRCEGCKNAFGRKDGSALTGIEAEPDEDETEACEKSLVDKPEIRTIGEQNPSSLPMTPLRISRQLVPSSFSSKGKPPRSSFLTITSSSGLYGGQKLGKPDIQQSHPKFFKQMQTAPEDEMPEILQGDCSPSTGIKTSSPNNKRISPPHSVFGSSPARRSGRKLILQSIPSFPSLTPRH